MKILTNGKFTGWHMTAILVVFFGIVMAVNFYMARMALSTFGGTVVDNSYVASQNYNRWLDASDRQDKLRWSVNVILDADRHVIVTVRTDGQNLTGVRATGDALHPLGRAEDHPLSFATTDNGQLRSINALPTGRWNVQLSLRRNADIFRMREQLR